MSPESESCGVLLRDVPHIEACLGQVRRHEGPRWPRPIAESIAESIAGLTKPAVTRIHLALPITFVILRSRRTSIMSCRAYGPTGFLR